jgi:predicted lipoprotein
MLGFTIFISGCKLATVVPLSKGNNTTMANQFNRNNFDANTYVDKVWDSKAIPYFESKAVDLLDLLKSVNGNFSEAGKKYGITNASSIGSYDFVVKGKVKVVKVNAELRARTLECTLPGYNGNVKITLQMGPVFTSSAIRDSLSFVKFEDFQNQVVFDSVSDAFNKHVYDNVISKIDINTLVGKNLTFIGAFTGDDPSNVSIIPVELKVD